MKFNFIKNKLLFLITPLFLFIGGCVIENKNSAKEICRRLLIECIRTRQSVEIHTNKGKMTFELYGDFAPVTTSNFLDLVERDFYINSLFHRVIKEPFPFVIQGGSAYIGNKELSNNDFLAGDFVDPINNQSRFIPLEITLEKEEIPRYSKIIKDPIEINQIKLRHERGSLSMARSAKLDSASSQFYISLNSLPVLDGRYAVFGKIVKGRNVLKLIKKGDFIEKIVHLSK